MVVSLRFWLPYGVLVAAGLLWADAARSGSAASMTMASNWWMLMVPPAVLVLMGLGVWNEAHGDIRTGRTIGAIAASLAGYHVLQLAPSALANSGAPGWATFLVDSLFASAWMMVLMTSQLCAVVVFAQVSGQPQRSLRTFLLVTLAVALILSTQSFAPGIGAAAIYGWMASLSIVPLALWRRITGLHGPLRRAAIKTVLGSLAPTLVVILCGLLAVAVAYGTAARGLEVDILGTGFVVGDVLCAVLFTSALRTARIAASRTSPQWLSGALRAALWGIYILAVTQMGGLAGQFLGGHPADTAIATSVLGSAVFFPWRHLVAKVLALAHPQRAATAVMVAARSSQAREEPLELAQKALRAALDESHANIRILLPGAESDLLSLQGSPGTVSELVRDSNGNVIAAVEHGGTFADIASIIAILLPLLERAALQAELRQQGTRLAAERKRADEAAREERRRLERDLHDGIQGRILSLGLNLSLAAGQLNDPESKMLVTDTVEALAAVLAELRGLAAGEVPELLSTAGLAAAVADFVRPLPIPISVDLPPIRLTPALESVAYFVIAEALTNALKHGAPHRVWIVAQIDAKVYSLQIRDDGCGGADPRGGSGLRGLTERVHSAGGRLLVSEARPGTLVEVSLPCG